MRRELVIKVDYLNREFQKNTAAEQPALKLPWAIDENERMQYSAVLYPRSRLRTDYRENVYCPSGGLRPVLEEILNFCGL
jgi:hypothetical protein